MHKKKTITKHFKIIKQYDPIKSTSSNVQSMVCSSASFDLASADNKLYVYHHTIPLSARPTWCNNNGLYESLCTIKITTIVTSKFLWFKKTQELPDTTYNIKISKKQLEYCENGYRIKFDHDQVKNNLMFREFELLEQ